MTPIISIIIPCYNSGMYLPEAINSITSYPNKDLYEIIIVNDGSTDEATIILLGELENQGFTVIHQDNKGPAAARNKGVLFARGEYLLFLDSDNKIRNAYIDRGIEILSTRDDISIVYGKPNFFGDTTEPRFAPEEFNLSTILARNYIDTCSVMRKDTFDLLGGFDEDKSIIGYEDWEFWIRAGSAGIKFYYLHEVVFDYRILGNSLIKQAVKPERRQKVLRYIYIKHIDLFIDHYRFLNGEFNTYLNDRNKPLRSFVKYSFTKLFKKNKI